MHLYLTDEQHKVVESEADRPINVIDPATERTYVLIPHEEFERLRPLLPVGSQAVQPSPEPADRIPPGIRQSQEAYWRDLPQLLKLKSPECRWVAYRGDERVGFGRTSAELYAECLHQRGYNRHEIYVDRVEPRALPPWEAEEIDSPFEQGEVDVQGPSPA